LHDLGLEEAMAERQSGCDPLPVQHEVKPYVSLWLWTARS
jgi:hypothetical protein